MQPLSSGADFAKKSSPSMRVSCTWRGGERQVSVAADQWLKQRFHSRPAALHVIFARWVRSAGFVHTH